MCNTYVRLSCHLRHQNHHYCLQRHPEQYIRLVQRLVEECLIFRLDRDECVRALEKHANLQPAITLAVWNGLVRQNPAFFRAYLSALRSPTRSLTDMAYEWHRRN